ncbi:type I-E CRISPR-associated protein Cas6/Cse3/CasE [Enterobacter chengduensis]|uniref:type I-E CRISPR-associated protein Cas6/Cse3/CasE n=1 Tax=Enterobacter chengduensis TaxID=2494701 RepID=UPI002002C870|nr:type I-E CRISPR-associated protein Cas6/Cse3/CasE [Enterobacter chengduensis]MCK7429282.1 type I-E CRISPR-associated protein Cas6/Cse3/CasE [Enterobacter chengduensis]
MYLSKITLDTTRLAPEQLLQLVEHGEYAMHQWLWRLFPGTEQRSFLYRREELQGAFRFFVLSPQIPASQDIFTVESRPFEPVFSPGLRLRFTLRANPTLCKAGKRHDLLMEAKLRVKNKVEKAEIWPVQQQAALEWLQRQGERSGFSLVTAQVEGYRQQLIVRAKNRQRIQFSTVDYSGVIDVRDPARFHEQLTLGFGKSRAFGCGLMLIKPEIAA